MIITNTLELSPLWEQKLGNEVIPITFIAKGDNCRILETQLKGKGSPRKLGNVFLPTRSNYRVGDTSNREDLFHLSTNRCLPMNLKDVKKIII